jgi:ubiquinone/menaquinone biosynthesis C-methylase UbiE
VLDARIKKSQVPSVYRKIAPVYDLWAMLTESKARSLCLQTVAIRDGETVLEVAVGTGMAFAEILKANPSGRNEGIDLTEQMLNRAKKKAAKTGAANYRLTLGDAYALTFADESFDVVINNYMFDLIPENDFKTVLGEFNRVLRPGGRLAMVNMSRCERWNHALWELIYRINPAWLGGCRGVYILPFLESAGFQQIKREYISQMTFPSEVVFAVKPKV